MREQTSTIADGRYMIDDLNKAIGFYVKYLGFPVESDTSPAFATIQLGYVYLPLGGKDRPE